MEYTQKVSFLFKESMEQQSFTIIRKMSFLFKEFMEQLANTVTVLRKVSFLFKEAYYRNLYMSPWIVVP